MVLRPLLRTAKEQGSHIMVLNVETEKFNLLEGEEKSKIVE